MNDFKGRHFGGEIGALGGALVLIVPSWSTVLVSLRWRS